MKGNRVLVDTSVWIAYFRNTSPELSQKLEELMSDSEVCIPRIVIAELIQGSKSDREISTIENLADAFVVIDQTEATWVEAGKLAYKLKKKGQTINLADCYIASIAQEQGCDIFTLDQHFKQIQDMTGISLI
jgi:predicted nucleic acid-binding protein